jgi:hypothetical protein
MESRRDFLKRAQVTLLLVPIAGLAGVACGNSSGGSSSGCDGPDPTSSVTNGHTHTVCVESTDLTTPPANGVTFTTSVTEDHTHTVSLTQTQLQTIAMGQEVTVPTSVNAGHMHTFMIVKTA